MRSHLKDIVPRPSHPKKVDREEGLGKHVTTYTSLWSGVKPKMLPYIIVMLPLSR